MAAWLLFGVFTLQILDHDTAVLCGSVDLRLAGSQSQNLAATLRSFLGILAGGSPADQSNMCGSHNFQPGPDKSSVVRESAMLVKGRTTNALTMRAQT